MKMADIPVARTVPNGAWLMVNTTDTVQVELQVEVQAIQIEVQTIQIQVGHFRHQM
jgi:2-methylisocitrate lyase-like PEP mutase family enzyme